LSDSYAPKESDKLLNPHVVAQDLFFGLSVTTTVLDHEFSLLVGAHYFLESLVDCQLHSKAMYPLVLFVASHLHPFSVR